MFKDTHIPVTGCSSLNIVFISKNSTSSLFFIEYLNNLFTVFEYKKIDSFPHFLKKSDFVTVRVSLLSLDTTFLTRVSQFKDLNVSCSGISLTLYPVTKILFPSLSNTNVTVPSSDIIVILAKFSGR